MLCFKHCALITFRKVYLCCLGHSAVIMRKGYEHREHHRVRAHRQLRRALFLTYRGASKVNRSEIAGLHFRDKDGKVITLHSKLFYYLIQTEVYLLMHNCTQYIIKDVIRFILYQNKVCTPFFSGTVMSHNSSRILFIRML